MHKSIEAVIIGAGILDIPAGPVDASVFASGSHPVDNITLHVGGDALNEATILSRLGRRVRLLGKIGEDAAGRFILEHCAECGIETRYLKRERELDTGINLVLVGPDGERSFITSRGGSLRALRPEDIPPSAFAGARLLCFASVFVFPHIGPRDLAAILRAGREQRLLLCADFTKPKNAETVADIAEALSLLDYIFPNYEEARMLTGKADPDEIADAFLGCGVGNVALKLGREGCFLKSASYRGRIPAYDRASCVDTTGAGDSFAAGFLCALLEGRSLPECGRFANAAASLAIEGFGASGSVKSYAQVLERYAQIPVCKDDSGTI